MTHTQTESVSKRRLGWSGVSPLFLFLLWTGIGFLFALSWYLPAGSEGARIPFKTAATWHLLSSYLWLALCPLIFYLHRRFPIEVASVYGYRGHLLLALLVSWLHFSIFIGLDRLLDPTFSARFQTVRKAMMQLFLFRTLSGTVTYALILAVLCARDYYVGLRTERERRMSLEYQLAKAELTALRMQLQPHFLFNTLHSVSALIEEQPREAIRMITRLGSFLRVTLESSATQLVSLDEEVRFLELYFQIEQVRVGDRVRFLVEIDPATASVLVPNLILQPLVENALRHGAWQQALQARVTVASRILDDSLEIVVRNEFENPSSSQPSPINEGIGLSNVRSRLQQLFPARFRFEYGWISAGMFQVSLVLPANSGTAKP
jgi:two-component system, LytTR family, sensor kinase